MLSINLAISNLCSGNCIFCPHNRGKRIPVNMPIEYAKKIVNEAASYEFGSIHPIKHFEVGENGDALLNPSFIDILRYIRYKFPNASIHIYTNFLNLKKDISEIIISEHLLDNIGVNVDGYIAEAYYRVKKMEYKTVEQNILDFIEVRKRKSATIPLHILSLTYNDYVARIYKRFGKLPSKIEDLRAMDSVGDDYALIEKKWVKILMPFDSLERSPVMGWSERNQAGRLHLMSSYLCPNYMRLVRECLVAPNGDIYACCLDDIQRITFGNITEKSVLEIWNSGKRRIFLEKIKARRYREIGYPCDTVMACQYIERPTQFELNMMRSSLYVYMRMMLSFAKELTDSTLTFLRIRD